MKKCVFVIALLVSAAALGGPRVAFVGDPQVDSEKELDYARRSIYSELRERKDLDLVVILGDLVNEKPSLIEHSEASLDSLPCPWIRVQGNHDDFSAPMRDTSFLLRNGWRLVAMNNVRRTSRRGYEGGFNTEQKHLLDSLCRLKGKLILCTHIPISWCEGQDSLRTLLQSGALLISGHTHTVLRHTLPEGCEEIVVGATCGTWWRGPKDAQGIPSGIMNCGAPRGYFVADFSSKGYRLEYKTVGRDDKLRPLYRDGKLYVNVYGGAVEGQVFVRQGCKWVELARCEETDPTVADIIAYNASHKRGRREEFLPMLDRPSPHLWAVPYSVGKEKVKLKYRDPHMKFSSSARVLQ